MTTLEASPVGLNPPSLTSLQSTSVGLIFTVASMENGVVTYQLIVSGIFMGGNGGQEERIVYSNTTVPTTEITVGDLFPFTLYSTYVNASNTVAVISSQSLIFRTDGTGIITFNSDINWQFERNSITIHYDFLDPELFSAPSVLSTSSTTITVTWQPPGKANGNISHYDVYAAIQNIIIGPQSVNSGDMLIVLISNLRPATVYNLYVIAYNQFGNATSAVTQQRTDDGGMLNFHTLHDVIKTFSPIQ